MSRADGDASTSEYEPESGSDRTGGSSPNDATANIINDGPEDGTKDGSEYTRGALLTTPAASREVFKVKRVRGFTPAYRILYNAEIVDASQRFESDPLDSFLQSQNGGSVWTPEEKQILFTRLPRLGRHDVRGLSNAIGTKSETEVQDYLLLLQRGGLESALSAKQQDFGPEDVPSAFEVSPECERRLEQAAVALCARVEHWDQQIEHKRHGNAWLLTAEVATEVEEILNLPTASELEPNAVTNGSNSSTHGEEALRDLTVPSAELLHLSKWLDLSRLFMISALDNEDDWCPLVTNEEEKPAIFHTAFIDFENLTIMLTTRLIEASIFQAMSRIRASDQVNPGLYVRSRDVQAATRFLGLDGDWDEFWITCARRNKLDVYANPRPNPDGRRRNVGYDSINFEGRKKDRKGFKLTYDEVESALRTTGDWTEDGVAQSEPAAVAPALDEAVLDDDELYDNSDFWTTASNGSDSEDNQANSSSAKQSRVEVEDAYLEALDQKSSKAEMNRLWAVLGRAADNEVKEEEEAELPPLPLRKRKRATELRDWVEDTRYQGSWEMNEQPLNPDAFKQMEIRGQLGRKRRREAYQRILREQDADYVDDGDEVDGDIDHVDSESQDAEDPEGGDADDADKDTDAVDHDEDSDDDVGSGAGGVVSAADKEDGMDLDEHESSQPVSIDE